jgi:membrane-associated phospholipid phosphatase
MNSFRIVLVAVLLASHPLRAGADEEAIADVFTGVVPLGALYVAHNKDDKEGKGQWFRSTATSLVINTALRVAFNETEYGTRPNGHPYGFPSGHMSFIVSGAAFLQERYGYRYGIPAYALSAYTAWVRVDTGHHYWRDIVAATALAYGVSRVLVTPLEPVKVAPLIEQDALGVRLAYDW